MSDSESERQRQLECLRLASDFAQLASESTDPELKARFLRTAKMWSEQAEQPPLDRN